jgi:Protein of unknown function (DUF3987)
MTPEEIARQLGGDKARRSGKGWSTICPAHEDRNPSLSVGDGDNGGIVVRCHAGCPQDDVIAALEAKGIRLNGRDEAEKPRIAATYDYVDEFATPIFQTVRYIPKAFKQRHPDGTGDWVWNLQGIKVVPYNLPAVIEAIGAERVVLVVEGEKDVDNLAKLGVTATCNHGGAKKWRAEHAGFLKGADVVIIPDNDAPGQDHVDIVAKSLARIAARIRVLRLPGLPEKGDVSDWIAVGGTRDQLDALIDATPDWTSTLPEEGGAPNGRAGDDTWPDPDLSLIDDDRIPAPIFPWDAVPPGWVDWLKGASEDTGAPVDYLFANLLGTASGIIGNARRVSPWRGWVEQPHLWIANVGNPSAMKTPALAPFKLACRAIEKREQPALDEALQRWETKVEAAKAATDAWKDSVKGAVKNGRDPPEKPANALEPERPPPPRILISDATTEAAVDLLAHNPRGVVLTRSELAGWLGQLDRYGGAGADRAFYIEAWDGQAHVVDRVKNKGEPIRVPYASLAIAGTIQPEKLGEVFTAPDDGLVARFLFIWPEPLEPRQPLTAGQHQRAAFLEQAFGRLRQLRMDRDPFGEPVPVSTRLDGEGALEVLNKVRKEVFEANKQETGVIAGWRGKNPGRLLRIALVIELLEWAASDVAEPPTRISATSIKRAAEYLDYAAAMMIRCLGELMLTKPQRDAAKVARLIMDNRMPELNPRDLYQGRLGNSRARPLRGFHGLRNNAHRKAVITELEGAEWIRPRQRGTWAVNPKILRGS